MCKLKAELGQRNKYFLRAPKQFYSTSSKPIIAGNAATRVICEELPGLGLTFSGSESAQVRIPHKRTVLTAPS